MLRGLLFLSHSSFVDGLLMIILTPKSLSGSELSPYLLSCAHINMNCAESGTRMKVVSIRKSSGISVGKPPLQVGLET